MKVSLLSTQQLERIQREFAKPSNAAEALILRGVEAELQCRSANNDDAIIEELEDDLSDMERMRDEALAESAERASNTLAGRVEKCLG